MTTIATKLNLLKSASDDMYSAIEYKRQGFTSSKIFSNIPSEVAAIKGVVAPAKRIVSGSAEEKLGTTLLIKQDIAIVLVSSSVAVSNSLASYGDSIRAIVTGGGSHTLEIVGASSVEAETATYVAVYDGDVIQGGAVWTISAGSQYASINSSGELTVDSSANNSTVTISCSYNGTTATKTVTVKYKSGSSSQTEVDVVVDPETGETTTTTTTVVENQDGSSTTETTIVHTDENGSVTGTTEIETNVNTNGSSTSTTTNYDENGNATSGSSNTTDTSGNSNTQEYDYDENGDRYVTGYTIDTNDNPNGGETISSGLDTGMIAFDGHGFTIHLKIKLDPSQLSSNTNVYISAIQNESNNKYSGFCVMSYNKNNVISFGGQNTQIKNSYFGSRITGTVNGSTGVQQLSSLKNGSQEITIDITYIPQSLNPEWKYTIYVSQLYTSTTSTSKKSVAQSTMYSNSPYIPESLTNATVHIGSYGLEHTHDIANMEVLEFEVRKT